MLAVSIIYGMVIIYFVQLENKKLSSKVTDYLNEMPKSDVAMKK